jgi:hypothetical protein
MVPRSPLIKYMTHKRMALAASVFLIIGLTGCASPRAGPPPTNTAPYVGVFTGEYVDGKPLYRLPAIEIVGSRSSVGPST